MRIPYATAIVETIEELTHQERALRGTAQAVRVRALLLVKTGQVPSLRAAAPLLGFDYRTLQAWWRRYRTGGLAGLVAPPVYPGKRPRLTAAAWAGLEAAMLAGEIATLKDAQGYLAREHGIHYASLNGIWYHLHRRGARPKTGRRRHRRANAEQQAEWKRATPRAAPGRGGRPALGLR